MSQIGSLIYGITHIYNMFTVRLLHNEIELTNMYFFSVYYYSNY